MIQFVSCFVTSRSFQTPKIQKWLNRKSFNEQEEEEEEEEMVRLGFIPSLNMD